MRRPARKAAAEAQRRATYAEGVLKGAVHEAATGGAEQRDPARLNDQGLEAKVESEVFRGADSPKDAVNVNVEAGVAYLCGQLDSAEEIDRVTEAVREVEFAPAAVATVHPSAILRAPEDEDRAQAFADLVADLGPVAAAL